MHANVSCTINKYLSECLKNYSKERDKIKMHKYKIKIENN